MCAPSPGAVVLRHDLSRASEGEVTRRVWDDRGRSPATTVPLVNNCPCSTFREDLPPQFARIAKAGWHELAVVELWGGSDPQPLVEALAVGEAELDAGKATWKALPDAFADLFDPVPGTP